MTTPDIFRSYGEELDRRLRLKTFPLAVKLLEKEGDIPKGAIRPMRDLGYHLSLCQCFAMSRRERALIAELKEDMWCVEPVIGYGLAEAPEYFLEGHNRFPHDVKTLEAGSNYAHELPHLEVGKYIGVVSAPLTTVDFEPDVVVIYCDSPQLNLLLLAKEYEDGLSLTCSLNSHAACVWAVVPIIQGEKYQVSIPCRGDRYRAMALDDEMIFSVAKEKVEDLLVGLRHLEEYGSRLPRGFTMKAEYELMESYAKIGRMLGMEIPE